MEWKKPKKDAEYSCIQEAIYQILIVHLFVMKHIWIGFLRTLSNFHQLVAQSEKKAGKYINYKYRVIKHHHLYI